MQIDAPLLIIIFITAAIAPQVPESLKLSIEKVSDQCQRFTSTDPFLKQQLEIIEQEMKALNELGTPSQENSGGPSTATTTTTTPASSDEDAAKAATDAAYTIHNAVKRLQGPLLELQAEGFLQDLNALALEAFKFSQSLSRYLETSPGDERQLKKGIQFYIPKVSKKFRFIGA